MTRRASLIGDDPALEVEGLLLSPLGSEDAADLFRHFADSRVTDFLDIDPLVEPEEASSIIAWAEQLRARGAGVRWSVRARKGGAFIGTCGFNSLQFERGRRGEVAYDLGVAWWGRGVMAKLMPALVHFGFETLKLHRLEAQVTPGNDRSCAVLERHGFVREGVLRGYGFWKGAWQDQILYARLAGRGRDVAG